MIRNLYLTEDARQILSRQQELWSEKSLANTAWQMLGRYITGVERTFDNANMQILTPVLPRVTDTNYRQLQIGISPNDWNFLRNEARMRGMTMPEFINSVIIYMGGVLQNVS